MRTQRSRADPSGAVPRPRPARWPTRSDKLSAGDEVVRLARDEDDRAARLVIPQLLEHQFSEVQNPMLGLRSIRLSLLNTPMFKRQLRAILRASVHGNVRVMFPLISTLLEFRQAKMILMKKPVV